MTAARLRAGLVALCLLLPFATTADAAKPKRIKWVIPKQTRDTVRWAYTLLIGGYQPNHQARQPRWIYKGTKPTLIGKGRKGRPQGLGDLPYIKINPGPLTLTGQQGPGRLYLDPDAKQAILAVPSAKDFGNGQVGKPRIMYYSVDVKQCDWDMIQFDSQRLR